MAGVDASDIELTSGRVSGIKHYRDADTSVAAEINGYVYGWDPANRLAIDAPTLALYEPERLFFEYNQRGELTGATQIVGWTSVESYDYDENGNRLATSLAGIDQTYGDPGDHNQLLDDDLYIYAYDESGNRQTRTPKGSQTDERQVLTWDHRNRLATVVDYDANDIVEQTVTYIYDSLNQLIGRHVDDVANAYETKRYFAHFDGQIIHQFDGYDDAVSSPTEPHLTHRYLWGPQVDQLLADDRDGRILWSLTDHLGTVKDIVEHDAFTAETTLLKHRTYDSFGNITGDYDRGDFNDDGVYDVNDIDLLFATIQAGTSGYDETMDLNSDETVDVDDIELLVQQIYGTQRGDADLDGDVDGTDYTIFAAHFGDPGGWSFGNNNGNTTVDGPDWTALAANNGFDNGQGHINTTEFLFGFTGRMLDNETGLQNNLNRWYDADVGQWDPIPGRRHSSNESSTLDLAGDRRRGTARTAGVCVRRTETTVSGC